MPNSYYEMYDSLKEAKRHLRANMEKGLNCPCCGQMVKLYNYKLFSTSAAALIRLYNLGGEYHHVREFAEANNKQARAPHFAELRHWELVQAGATDGFDNKSSGYWSITDKGEKFVQGLIKVPERILIFNNKLYGFRGVDIDIKQALSNKFSYAELMEVE
jgi:hypothetical protein